MKQHCRHLSMVLASLLVAYCGAAGSAILYTRTLGTTPAAVVNADPNFPFSNCVAAEGCFGNVGLVDTPANLPNTFTFNFTLTPSEVIAVTTNPGTAVLTLVAARDIGHRVADAASDWVVATIEGNPLANLFQNTIDSCPPGERGSGYPQATVCGPNFHTDITALDSVTISQSVFRAAAADGTIQIVLDPTDSVGRLKIFSVRLESVTAVVPEPATLGLAVLGLAALGFGRRKKPS